MSAFVSMVAQAIASFALHALWQAPLLAGAAALAIRVGRPRARTAYALWAATLLLCVLMPVGATITARRAAMEAERTAVRVTYDGAEYAGELPEMQRKPAWQRMIDQHFSVRAGLRPFSFTLPVRVAGGVGGIYLLIALSLAVRLGVAWVRSRRLVRASSSLPETSAVARAMRRQCEVHGMEVPEARVSEDLVGPALAGVLRPTLLLPACAEQMSEAEVEAVLAHELAHVRRHDLPVHLVCSLLLVPVGFHPAALWVAKRVRQTREMACDAEAAGQMGSAARYARALLQVAELTGAGGERAYGLGLFQTGLGLFSGELGLFDSLELTGGAMEERMQVMMQGGDSSSKAVRVARWSACVAMCGVAALTAAMVQVQPAVAQQAAQTMLVEPQTALLGGAHAQETLHKAGRDLAVAESKALTDEDRKKIATARAVLGAAQQQLAAADGKRGLDPQVRAQIEKLKDLKMDAKAMAELEKLRTLDLGKMRADLEASRAEMESHRAEVDRQLSEIRSPEFQAKLRAQVEAARKQLDRSKIDAMMAAVQQQRAAAEQMRAQMDAAMVARNEAPVMPGAAVAANQATKPLKVDAAKMAGNVLNKVQPVYPPSAKDAHISGAVVLHAIINEGGTVEGLQVLNSPDDALSKSAMEAVQQWTYKPYLLNGNPTAVETTITVNYSFGG